MLEHLEQAVTDVAIIVDDEDKSRHLNHPALAVDRRPGVAR
jgi:hypothetical protein